MPHLELIFLHSESADGCKRPACAYCSDLRPVQTGCTSGSPTAADAIEDEVHEVLAICEGDAVAALRITLIANAFLKAEIDRSLPRCHPASRVARLERRPWRKKLSEKNTH